MFSHPLLTPAAAAEVPAAVRAGLPAFVQQAIAALAAGTDAGGGFPELSVEVTEFHPLTLAAARAQEGAPLAAPKLVSWALDLLRAVVHAGSARVVHLDIKPDNVLLRADGGGAVLGDWGCAVQCATDAMTRLWEPRESGLDAGGMLGGARARLAPEVHAAAAVVLVHQQREAAAPAARGGGAQAAMLVPLGKADVWAVGVLLYELALGAHPWPNYPFNGLATTELTGVAGAALMNGGASDGPAAAPQQVPNAARAYAWARSLGEPPPLPAYPDPLRDLLRWMVAPNPSQRCSPAGALARLERIAQGLKNIVPIPSLTAWQAEAARIAPRPGSAAAAASEPAGGAPFLLHVSDPAGGTVVIPVLPAPQRPAQAASAGRPVAALPVPPPTVAGVVLAKDAVAIAWEMLRVSGCVRVCGGGGSSLTARAPRRCAPGPYPTTRLS